MIEPRPRIFDEAYLVNVQCANCGTYFDAVSHLIYWGCPKCGKTHDNNLSELDPKGEDENT